MRPIAEIFCDTAPVAAERENNPERRYEKDVRLENAKAYGRYMTTDMRHALKSYLTLWYAVYGKRYYLFTDKALRKRRDLASNYREMGVCNCWL